MVDRCYHCRCREAEAYGRENGYSLVRCSKCRLLYVSNPPDPGTISEAARQGIHEGEETFDATGRFRAWRLPILRRRLQRLFPGPDGFEGVGRWLDVGCGHGELLAAVRELAPEVAVRGTEPNERKQESARSRGFDVSFFDLATHEETYDVVSLMNVYSHLPDPPGFLAMVRRLLRPGGRVLLQTGDIGVFEDRTIPKPWYLPDHLSFASEAIVREMLEHGGFEVERVAKFRYLEPTVPIFAKEAVKFLLPGRPSRLGDLLRGAPEADMHVLARTTDAAA